MKKYIFLDSYLKKRVFFLFAVALYFSYLYFFLLLIIYLFFLYLFRKQEIKVITGDFRAPVNGKVVSTAPQQFETKISALNGYGIVAIGSGEVVSYFETNEEKKFLRYIKFYKSKANFSLNIEGLGKVNYKVSSRNIRRSSTIWIHSGDFINKNAYLGYLPFGGKIVIEVPAKISIDVTKKQKLVIANTKILSQR